MKIVYEIKGKPIKRLLVLSVNWKQKHNNSYL